MTVLSITEPASGSDAASIRTTAKLEGGELILRGEKTFITSADVANVLVVLARSDAVASRAAGFLFVVVDTEQMLDPL